MAVDGGGFFILRLADQEMDFLLSGAAVVFTAECQYLKDGLPFANRRFFHLTSIHHLPSVLFFVNLPIHSYPFLIIIILLPYSPALTHFTRPSFNLHRNAFLN